MFSSHGTQFASSYEGVPWRSDKLNISATRCCALQQASFSIRFRPLTGMLLTRGPGFWTVVMLSVGDCLTSFARGFHSRNGHFTEVVIWRAPQRRPLRKLAESAGRGPN